MKINFSKKEYRLLCEMLFVADWIIASDEEIKEEKTAGYAALCKKIKSYCKEMNSEELFEHSSVADEYYETQEYEMLLLEKHIEPYNENNFWESLIDGLAHRDVVRSIGEEAFKKLEGIDRGSAIIEAGERYAKEFSTAGLSRLELK